MEITPESICQILNEAFKTDPLAIQSMMCWQMPVSKKLADHPTIHVRQHYHSKEPLLTMLGLINGFVHQTGRVIASKWDDEPDAEGAQKMLGFCVVPWESVCSND